MPLLHGAQDVGGRPQQECDACTDLGQVHTVTCDQALRSDLHRGDRLLGPREGVKWTARLVEGKTHGREMLGPWHHRTVGC